MHVALAQKSLDPLAEVATKAEIDDYERRADPDGKFLLDERRRRAWHLYQADQARCQFHALKARRVASDKEQANA